MVTELYSGATLGWAFTRVYRMPIPKQLCFMSNTLKAEKCQDQLIAKAI